MKTNEILPYWRVVLFKSMYWIQFFCEKPDGFDGYETFTRSSVKPICKGSYLIIFNGGKSLIVYLNDVDKVAVPLFVADKQEVYGRYLKFSYRGETYYWEPEMLNCPIGMEGYHILDTAAKMRTIVCMPGTEKYEQIRKGFEALSRCGQIF